MQGSRTLPVSTFSFQFLGIPPKGERFHSGPDRQRGLPFPISRDPPEGGTLTKLWDEGDYKGQFPISRDPPEGGTFD